MNTNLIDDNIYKIPIKVDDYDSLFNEFDFSDLSERDLNEDIDDLIDKYILKCPKKIKHLTFELIISLPKEVKNPEKEIAVEKGIYNYYKGYLTYQKRLTFTGIKRIAYYMFSAFILLSVWYLIRQINGDSLVLSLLNSGGTVLLWEVMSLIFIERKNANDKANLKRKLMKMKITFRYRLPSSNLK